MTTIDVNCLIANAAKSVLRPLGCRQKGKSRTWLDCQPLWVGVVEFQPSSWAKGSYLNVGACWLWYDKDYLSFDEGYRVEAFKSFENDEQFSEAAESLAMHARDEVLSLRTRFSSPEQIAEHLKSKDFSNIWHNYHAAVAAALTNDLLHANKRFVAVSESDVTYPWAMELKERASTLHAISSDSIQFSDAINRIVESSKARLKLG
jgi:hypothetical protein